ncbi:hypothetical protein PFISCL1PPCAC_10355, partial [Pristionchus fissidentatus]
MPLREWTCNEEAVHKEYADDAKESLTTFLGVGWDVAEDRLTIKTVATTGKALTKRTVLSETMSTFDPMGWISPALLASRRFMQKISAREWDSTLPEDEQVEWLSITSELADREVVLDRRTLIEDAELHVFTDASGCIGYGAAVYVRSRKGGEYETFLLMAKSKGTAGYVLRFLRRLVVRTGIKMSSEFLTPHEEEWNGRLLSPRERYQASRMLISESVKECPPAKQTIQDFGLRYDGATWRACTSGESAANRLKESPLPQRWQKEWFTIEDGRVVLKSNDSLFELQATIEKWRVTPVEDLSTCRMKEINPFRIVADLALVSISDFALVDARQAIPVIVKNIIDLSLSSYEYCFVIIIVIVIL